MAILHLFPFHVQLLACKHLLRRSYVLMCTMLSILRIIKLEQCRSNRRKTLCMKESLHIKRSINCNTDGPAGFFLEI